MNSIEFHPIITINVTLKCDIIRQQQQQKQRTTTFLFTFLQNFTNATEHKKYLNITKKYNLYFKPLSSDHESKDICDILLFGASKLCGFVSIS